MYSSFHKHGHKQEAVWWLCDQHSSFTGFLLSTRPAEGCKHSLIYSLTCCV